MHDKSYLNYNLHKLFFKCSYYADRYDEEKLKKNSPGLLTVFSHLKNHY